MIVTRIKGGLGNQLFQYATTYSIARSFDKDVQLDVSFFCQQKLRDFKINCLNIQYTEMYNAKNASIGIKLIKNKYVNKFFRVIGWKHLTYSKNKIYVLESDYEDQLMDFSQESKKEIYLDGYFQQYEYFNKYRSELIDQFKPNYPLCDDYILIQKQLKSTNSIAIHIRFGDFANDTKNRYHYILEKTYYEKAIAYIEEKLENTTYFVFSDDHERAIKFFGSCEKFHYISMHSDHPDIDEMLLMSECKNIITANSTFSWWAAWLNTNTTALIIVPERQYGPNGLIPTSWIKL